MPRYAHNAGAVYSLKLHIVWCPKYRRRVLENGVDVRLKELLHNKSAELGWTIHALEVMPDHVHVFLEHDPSMGVAEIVNRLKGFTSNVLRKEFPSLRSRLPTLWSRSYFCASIGSVSEERIKQYILEQKRR